MKTNMNKYEKIQHDRVVKKRYAIALQRTKQLIKRIATDNREIISTGTHTRG